MEYLCVYDSIFKTNLACSLVAQIALIALIEGGRIEPTSLVTLSLIFITFFLAIMFFVLLTKQLQNKYCKIMMWIRIQIQIRGGGSSAKNVHPPWQNPRYDPGGQCLFASIFFGLQPTIPRIHTESLRTVFCFVSEIWFFEILLPRVTAKIILTSYKKTHF